MTLSIIMTVYRQNNKAEVGGAVMQFISSSILTIIATDYRADMHCLNEIIPV